MYGLLFDTSKAFDTVNYCNLSRTLLDRKVCPIFTVDCFLICILIKYIGHRLLRIRWKIK